MSSTRPWSFDKFILSEKSKDSGQAPRRHPGPFGKAQDKPQTVGRGVQRRVSLWVQRWWKEEVTNGRSYGHG